MSKRIVVTMTVDDDTDTRELAMQIDGHFGVDADATVWEWDQFWADVDERVVTPDSDTTERRKCSSCGYDISEYAPGLTLCAICDPEVSET